MKTFKFNKFQLFPAGLIRASVFAAMFLFSLNAVAQWNSNATSIYPTTLTKKVGIGTSSPLTKFHVRDGDFRLDKGGTQYFDFKVDASGYLSIVRNGTTTAMTIGSSSGNVGIGTTTPSAKLHVKDGDFRMQNGTAFFDIKLDASGKLNFVPNNGTTTAMVIDDENGNVGIGTTPSSSAKLHLKDGDFRMQNGTSYFDLKVDAGGSLNFVPNGGTTTVMYIDDENGNVGIGTTTPSAKLHVRNGEFRLDQDGQNFDFKVDASGNLNFVSNPNTTAMVAMVINDDDGKVTIGSTTTPGSYKLYVEDGILTEKVKVAVKTTADWSDHVFAEDYPLSPLACVEEFILENKHLPGVPSAEQMVGDGLDVASMDAKLLEKIEELTLYLIELKKENDSLTTRISNLENR